MDNNVARDAFQIAKHNHEPNGPVQVLEDSSVDLYDYSTGLISCYLALNKFPLFTTSIKAQIYTNKSLWNICQRSN